MKEIWNMSYTYLSDLIKLWLILWGIMNFPPVRKKSIYIATGTAQLVLLVIAGFYYVSHKDLVAVFTTVVVIFAVCFLLEGNFFKKFAYSLLAYIIMMLLDACIIGIGTLLFNRSGHELINEDITRLISNIFNIFTIGIFAAIRRNKNKARTQIRLPKRIYALLFAGAGTGITMIAALVVRSNDRATESARKAMIVVTVIVVISYLAACLMMILVTESRDNYKALSMISQNIIESQQQYYTLVNEKQQEMRAIRHEMKNHLACIHGLYHSNKLEELDQYINDLIHTSDSTDTLFDTGNDIVNAILNDAQSRYKEDNIAIRLEGGFPKDLKIAPMDLCVIFANTVSNAVEAVKRLEWSEQIRYIDIKISSFKDDLFIDVVNPIGSNPDLHNGQLVTSKSDKTLHGFGVKNVIQRVEKYQGSFDFKIENNLFYVEIFMKNKT